MRIQFEQHGGAVGFVPGIARPLTIETDKLPPEQRQHACQLVDAAKLADLASDEQAEPHPNVPVCHLCVETDQGDRHDVRLAETAIPPQLRPLIDWLRNVARP